MRFCVAFRYYIINVFAYTNFVPARPRIVRVENGTLWGHYLLKKVEYMADNNGAVEEMKLWHSTRPDFAEQIAHENFNWRLCTNSYFGDGISFSSSADYGNFWSNIQNPPDERVLILANVLVNRVMAVDYKYNNVEIPPKYADTKDPDTEDTVTEDADMEDADTEDADTEDTDTEDADTKDADKKDANTKDTKTKDADTTTDKNGRGDVYVKYYDNEFYPEYLVYYTPNRYRRPR